MQNSYQWILTSALNVVLLYNMIYHVHLLLCILQSVSDRRWSSMAHMWLQHTQRTPFELPG